MQTVDHVENLLEAEPEDQLEDGQDEGRDLLALCSHSQISLQILVFEWDLPHALASELPLFREDLRPCCLRNEQVWV